jgi:hypothetical protein
MASAMAEHSILLAQVPAPPAPQAIVIDIAPGQLVELPTPPPDAVLAIDGKDVLVARPEAPPIVLRNFVEMAQADPPPVVQLADAAIPGPDLIGRLAPFDAVRVDTLLASLTPTEISPPARLAPLPDFLSPPVSQADANGDPVALRGDLRPAIEQAALPQIPASVPAAPSAPDSPATLETPPAPEATPPATTGDDTILGSPGDDRIAIDESVSFVDLGPGIDTLDLSAVANLDLGERDYNGVEKIDLRGGVANDLTLSASDVLDISPTTDTLLVRGEASDHVELGSGWTAAGTQANPQGETGTFTAYTQTVGGATATLLVESPVSAE